MKTDPYYVRNSWLGNNTEEEREQSRG